MALFQNPFKPQAPAPPGVPPPPGHLSKITAPTTTVCSQYTPHPEAKALLQPGQTPAQYTAALQKGKFSQDHIHFLAHGMPQRESVGWACKSSAKVADKLEPADKSALDAAHNWVKNPTPANQAAAAAAAAKTNYQGPGAWAAQGAAWAKTPGAPSHAAPHLTGHAVAGSVMLAAAKMSGKMPAVPAAPKAPTLAAPKLAAPTLPTLKAPTLAAPAAPAMPLAQRVEVAKIHQPFIELGQGIASGHIAFI
jgi:hypothetical protein